MCTGSRHRTVNVPLAERETPTAHPVGATFTLLWYKVNLQFFTQFVGMFGILGIYTCCRLIGWVDVILVL